MDSIFFSINVFQFLKIIFLQLFNIKNIINIFLFQIYLENRIYEYKIV